MFRLCFADVSFHSPFVNPQLSRSKPAGTAASFTRRELLKFAALGGAAAASSPWASAQQAVQKGSGPVKITDVKTILTQPAGDHLVIVKVLTSEPGLYGVGCATHRERPLAV